MPETLEVDDVTVHIEGTGPDTILMLHGWPDTYRLWDAQVAALQPRWRCVRLTLPGYDLARPRRKLGFADMSAFLLKVLDAVSPGAPVTLLLHDWGAIYGYQFAARHPERVRRIVGVDIGDTTSRAFLRSLGLKQKAMIVAYQVPLAIAWKIGGRFGDAISRRVAKVLRCPSDPKAIGSQMNYPYALTWTGGLRDAVRFEPHCPFLYVYGTRKPLMFHSPEWLERIGGVPGNEVHALRCGHWVMVQAREEFDAKVVQWLGRR
jgi:pimeloyl-ACP methyl ester carboxylesterase